MATKLLLGLLLNLLCVLDGQESDHPHHHQRLPLVYDIGFNTGGDTFNYLSQGYRVVAVEANPYLVQKALNRSDAFFSSAIKNNALHLLGVGIGYQGERSLKFYVNTLAVWSSFEKSLGCRTKAGEWECTYCSCKEIDVPVKTCADIVKSHSSIGYPLYMKIDIEGRDVACIESLKNTTVRPKYLSIEQGGANIPELSRYLDVLESLGYKHFKLVDQRPFDTPGFQSSGPFGEFAQDIETGLQFRTKQQLLSGKECDGNSHLIKQDFGSKSDTAWCDIHAKL
mmetsp:Transcript_3080/g.4795  ORF Transcript_3080/g.4795 Transcript_3080/m.4795 type:complete len:282 (+) Transcript_3080:90-935(+)|eukprot:CAMPEP_0174986774 /NCGR_PEP_ID=MMETSP0004_2-20121128/19157_1 /TAXON_ID=420556 /ORGANISM="Ochromonas sp., Strain CCMP1393" /LENGTH=281 /DNA_ID=CAMNT_0016239717 /DNA_START=35 /DNA_END=880 /DNA_ORIENTATION=+